MSARIAAAHGEENVVGPEASVNANRLVAVEHAPSFVGSGQHGGTAAWCVRVEPVHEGRAGEERRLDFAPTLEIGE